VVDWHDVKILQQFTDLLDGDANFDGAVDFLDLDLMAANYYTLPGQAAETWAQGDFASVDPAYPLDAPDANRVDSVDLDVLARTWLEVLSQPPVTAVDADARGYQGQFRTDLLAAFAPPEMLIGDFNGDGSVDAADYTVWRDSLGQTGPGLAADANGDLRVDRADYTLWKTHFGQMAAAGADSALSTPASLVPEPHSWACWGAWAAALAVRRRTKGR
jgi:hypothetical protein